MPAPRTARPGPRTLLVKLGAIGDSVMLLPAAHALHRAGHQVHWLCGRTVAPLLALYPWLHLIPADEAALTSGASPSFARELLRLSPTLARHPWDLVATLYYDPRYRLLTLPTRARRRLALSHTDRTRRLLPGRPHAAEYLRLLLGLPDQLRPDPVPPLPPSELPPSPLPRTPGRTRVVLVPGGARNTLREDALRRWPIEHYVTLAQTLLQDHHEVVLAGGPGDQWASSHFHHLPILDHLGRHSLVNSLGLFSSADAVVSHDTGPLHLAGLTRAAVIAPFGPTDPHVFLPRRPGVTALWGGPHLACRPCYDARTFAPCPANDCVRDITPSLVLHHLRHALASNPPDPFQILEPTRASDLRPAQPPPTT